MANKIFRGPIEDQADSLSEQAVKRIFELSASGVSQPKIPAIINQYHKANIGEDCVRRVLHREPPCEFEDVEIDAKTLEIVEARFRDYSRRAKKGARRMNGKCPTTDTDLLLEVLKTRLIYQAALNKAIEAGMNEESVTAWCDVVAKGDLR